MDKRIHATRFQDLAMQAGHADRARAHLNTHDSPDADVQRLFIATFCNTYIRPHRHCEAHKSEFFLLIEGQMDLLVFANNGEIVERCRMSPSDTRAVEVSPGKWHSYVCREHGTIALEVKQGAYFPTQENDFAPWSPAENTEHCERFLSWMRCALVGNIPA